MTRTSVEIFCNRVHEKIMGCEQGRIGGGGNYSEHSRVWWLRGKIRRKEPRRQYPRPNWGCKIWGKVWRRFLPQIHPIGQLGWFIGSSCNSLVQAMLGMEAVNYSKLSILTLFTTAHELLLSPFLFPFSNENVVFQFSIDRTIDL